VLAGKTGLSVRLPQPVERDRSTPSINALHAISRALGVTISWFFDAGEIPPASAISSSVARAGGASTSPRGSSTNC
jgi:transcriptional regulator with XRE-family HTH domain